MGGISMANALEKILAQSAEEARSLGTEYMPGEINQQPDAWRSAAEFIIGKKDEISSILAKGEQIILSGAGTSDYVGRSVETLLRHSLGKDVKSRPSTDLVTDPEGLFPKKPFVLISFARSGNSPEGNAAFNLANQLRPEFAHHIVVTCNPKGELARLALESKTPALLLLMPPETNDRALAMTSSYSSMVVAAQGFAFLDQPDKYKGFVEQLAGGAETFLATTPDALLELAGEGFTRAVFLGSNALFGAAWEGHLKVQEMTAGKVICKAESMLGLRHGPMAVIHDDTLVVYFLSSDPYVLKYDLDLMGEVKAKGIGYKTVAICQEATDQIKELADLVLESKTAVPDDLLAPMFIVPAQLLALFKSLSFGLTPDAPSAGGVINRVVKGVQIYPYKANA
jgi:tagatose-6-phosphate ketose/aldose isomerase